LLKVVTPPLRVPVPNVTLPSLNVTTPVAAEGVTLAVNVTELPKVDGLREEVSAVVVGVLPNTVPENAVPTSSNARNRYFSCLTVLSLGCF
jgi:hypothetical protein